MNNEIVTIFGWAAMAMCASVVLLFLLGVALYLVGILGKKLFNDLRRIYSLAVISYWLKRLEREGSHTFERAKREAQS